jgi:hypothetical protein
MFMFEHKHTHTRPFLPPPRVCVFVCVCVFLCVCVCARYRLFFARVHCVGASSAGTKVLALLVLKYLSICLAVHVSSIMTTFEPKFQLLLMKKQLFTGCS